MSAAAMATFSGNIILIFSWPGKLRKIFWPNLFFFPDIDNLFKIYHKHVPENKIRLQNQLARASIGQTSDCHILTFSIFFSFSRLSCCIYTTQYKEKEIKKYS